MEYKVIKNRIGEYWYVNDNLHREDGPAVICSDGYQQWWVNGKLHREDGPAVIYANGNQYWYINGKLHREDGPALIRVDGTQEWWINGKKVTEEEHKRITSKKSLDNKTIIIDGVEYILTKKDQ